MVKTIKLDKEEKELLKSIESDEWQSVENLESEKLRYQQIANNTMSKKAISIRLSEKDILKIKSIAIEEWIPYQTLISSIIHKFAEWKLKTKS